ncbi:MAG: hypothetical protein COU40_03020 [Candidatus Moranbacteria bacterium CG10_big_fil_rev_8_21_14_0_10_35_21]|nr:MAG: hypothetical protein COU40_03020 [Candidatus Moranbacteria bacterium CG10_big_fil_rev_8_21_14_0_10_35_21]PJA88270.1 MAG: hypothetical protein CO139_04025 [Candidatus Moranbacteria bacterium CG_4_9_14_3_um_filter_36_9]
MARGVILFIIIGIFSVFQLSVFPNFFPVAVIPDAVLVMVLLWSVRLDYENVWKRALLAGILVDLLMFHFLGVEALSFLIISFSISYITKRILVAHSLWKFAIIPLLILGAVMINDLILTIFSYESLEIFQQSFLSQKIFFNWPFLQRFFYDLILGALIYWPLKKLEEKMDNLSQIKFSN